MWSAMSLGCFLQIAWRLLSTSALFMLLFNKGSTVSSKKLSTSLPSYRGSEE
ncbi:unnamed protein product [Nezara viridula]|uniref:Uncharacterized protein n=1 Tax=Nezara viridula TaxID=85310 RepID=A0A9P0MIS7_NEZVI|nr:unnamed protein product [Nezara viridula]